MEKYEINKFISEYKEKLNDLYQAFNVKNKKEEYDVLAKEISKTDFWNDPENAQKIIAKSKELETYKTTLLIHARYEISIFIYLYSSSLKLAFPIF